MSHNMIRHVATAVLWSGGLARACHGPASASLPKGAQQSWRCFSVPSGGAGRGALVKPVKCVIFDKVSPPRARVLCCCTVCASAVLMAHADMLTSLCASLRCLGELCRMAH